MVIIGIDVNEAGGWERIDRDKMAEYICPTEYPKVLLNPLKSFHL